MSTKGIELIGIWKLGYAYDLHTISSEYYVDAHGHDRWNNTRSKMGELVYQLKYKNNSTVVENIVALLLKKYTKLNRLDAIIPAPPSKQRICQPVYEIALELGKKINVQVYLDVLAKNKGSEELKGIDNPNIRINLLKKSMYIHKKNTLAKKNILLIDDLYRSGSTLKIATQLLYNEAIVQNVYVLTMTKTRSKI